jgi:Flp pilus assembly protein TadG
MLLIVVLLPALFGLAALAINIAHMEAAKIEIQIAVDSAARAVGRTYAEAGNRAEALAAAKKAAARNPVGNLVVPIRRADMQFGNSDRAGEDSHYSLAPTSMGGNAVCITTTTLNKDSARGIAFRFPFFRDAFMVRSLVTATTT